MTATELGYLRDVASWRAGLSNQECRDFYADWRKGDNDPAVIDGAMEYVARRDAGRIDRGRAASCLPAQQPATEKGEVA